MIKMDNDFNKIILDKKDEVQGIQLVAMQQSYLHEFVNVPSSAMKALDLDIDLQDILSQKPSIPRSTSKSNKS
jgi:hypothetical protein